MIYVQELQSRVPFSAYDDLTPDEAGWVWQLTKRWLSFAGNMLRAGLAHERNEQSVTIQRKTI
jgi:hypothetical protein